MIRIIKNVVLILTVLLALLFALIVPPYTKKLLSMGVMSAYSASESKKSLVRTEGLDLQIPGGTLTEERDWYPFVMTFHPGEAFGRYIGQKTSLTILYNFGDFTPDKGCSSLYDPESPFYSSFYGAYLVKNADETPYGFRFSDFGVPVPYEQEIAKVARFDYQRLVLSDFGLTEDNRVFEFEITKEEKDTEYAGSGGWYRIDATLTVNGCAHNKSRFAASYLQYGIPSSETEVNLAPVGMFGRIYGKFIPEKGLSVFFYVIAADEQALEDCDDRILSLSVLNC